jgi:hemolysin activation/secretion protein
MDMTKTIKTLPLYCAILFVFGAGSAHATSVPSSADPARQLLGDQPKLPDFKKIEPDNRPTQTSIANAPDGSDKTFFVLKAIHIKGMTAYSPTSMEPLYAADLGQKISVKRLFDIMNSIQKRYLDDGYGLSRVSMPNQDIITGDVTFEVIEGYAADVSLDGDFPQSAVLDDAQKQIAAMRPLNTKKLEKLLLTLNDLPGLNVSAVLASLKDNPTPGGVRLILKQNPEKSYAANFSMNNHGSRFSGPTQLIASGRKSSVITPYDEVTATASAAIPMTEMRYAGLKYQRPVWGAHGLNLEVEASFSRTVPGDNLKALDVKGQSQSFKTGLSYSPIRQRDQTLELETAFEVRQSKTDFAGSELYDDRLRIFSLGANYNNADSFDGLNAFELTYSQGLNILGVREAGSPDLSRADGRPDFHKIYMSAGRLQTLPYRFEFLTAIQGQYAFDPLLSSEEFGFGGGQFGRGYDPSEITGDKGLSASFELRRNMYVANPDFAFQGYGFFDIGKVWNIDANAADKISAASTGLGLRIGSSYGWSGDINLAVPLTKKPDNAPKYTNGQSPRILFSVQKAF